MGLVDPERAAHTEVPDPTRQRLVLGVLQLRCQALIWAREGW